MKTRQRREAPTQTADPAIASDHVAARVGAYVAAASTAVQNGDVPALVMSAQRAVDLADMLEDDAETTLLMRIAGVLQAAFRFSGQPAMFDRALGYCLRVANRTQEPELAVPARALAGNVHMLAGRLHEAIEHCDAAVALASATELAAHRVAAMGHQFRAHVLMEWNQLAAARDALQLAWRLSGSSDHGVRSGVARVMAELELASGNVAEALRWSDVLTGIVSEPMSLRNREWLAAVRARHGFAAKRDLRALDAWQRRQDYRVESLEALAPSAIAARLQECEHLLTLLEITGQWEPLKRVAVVMERGSAPMRRWYFVRALTARAVSLEATGASAAADEVWSEALVAGDVGSFVRVYTDGSSHRLRLLHRAVGHPVAGSHAARVLDAMQVTPGSHPPAALTLRQRQVLQLVGKGLSDRDVSAAMGVSISTTKTHLRSIYERLRVCSRTAAVARAIELRLL